MILIGALYIFTTYAATITSAQDKFSGFAAYANGVPWDGLARTVSTVFWALVLFAIINSTLANANSGTNVFTRTAYALTASASSRASSPTCTRVSSRHGWASSSN